TPARKRLLKSSRLEVAENVVAAIKDAGTPPTVFLSSSAIGFYGFRGDDVVDEAEPAGGDFLASLSWEWERTARRAEDSTRVTLLRTGLVLGPGGGVLDALLPLFKLGLGGPWGSGEQWLSWIHMADQVGIMLFALDHDLAGPVNVTAPRPVTVNEFVTTLGKVVGKRAILPAPAFALRVGLGQAASALLDLQRVVPRRALGAGYEFRFPEVDAALRDLVPQ
ncbi:MAG: TIGR01777 family oxidoreductase, partial [Gemmatimonadales bacterium]